MRKRRGALPETTGDFGRERSGRLLRPVPWNSAIGPSAKNSSKVPPGVAAKTTFPSGVVRLSPTDFEGIQLPEAAAGSGIVGQHLHEVHHVMGQDWVLGRANNNGVYESDIMRST
jgi:hypothetical protein